MTGLHQGTPIHSCDGVDVIDCAACGFMHIMPLPDAAAQKKFYEEEFYQSEKSDYFDDTEADRAWHNISFGSRLAFVEDKLGEIGTALDIGCGPGAFLRVAQQRGWKTYGIEPSPLAVNYCNQFDLNVQAGFFGPDSQFETSFDFIHMSEVLEHVANPRELLDSAFKLLKPGGYITVSTPNDFNALQQTASNITDKDHWWVVPNHHINYFTLESLTQFIEAAGFCPSHITTNFPMELFLLMGDDYTNDPALGKECHNKRKLLDTRLFEQGIEVYNAFYQGLAAAGMGRLAIVTAQKPIEKRTAQ